MTKSTLPDNPFQHGLAAHISAIRTGNASAESTVAQCLQRVSLLDERLNAFQFVAGEQALQAGHDLDKAIQRGEDPGPLAGVVIGIKDIFSVDNMPTTNGSLHPNEHLNGPEGAVVRNLKAAGCIVLGKTRTVEFALGATGINDARGTPANAWDASTQRIPGGSSSGSAVAVAAGLCGFALGSDTGGSIRIPACLNGLVGHKTTVGLWPTDGIFPLSFSLDSAGALCRSTADAALVHSVITGEPAASAVPVGELRLGRPRDYFFDDLEDAVASNFERAFEQLKQAGVEFVELDIPEAFERDKLFPQIVPPELIAKLTPAGFEAIRADVDPVTETRAANGLGVLASDYIQARQRMAELGAIAAEKMTGLDGWIMPTCPYTAVPLASVRDGSQHDRAMLSSRNTMPINLFGMTALTLPTTHLATTSPGLSPCLPTGLQLVARANDDAKLLSIGMAVEALLGTGAMPDVSGFAD